MSPPMTLHRGADKELIKFMTEARTSRVDIKVQLWTAFSYWTISHVVEFYFRRKRER